MAHPRSNAIPPPCHDPVHRGNGQVQSSRDFHASQPHQQPLEDSLGHLGQPTSPKRLQSLVHPDTRPPRRIRLQSHTQPPTVLVATHRSVQKPQLPTHVPAIMPVPQETQPSVLHQVLRRHNPNAATTQQPAGSRVITIPSFLRHFHDHQRYRSQENLRSRSLQLVCNNVCLSTTSVQYLCNKSATVSFGGRNFAHTGVALPAPGFRLTEVPRGFVR